MSTFVTLFSKNKQGYRFWCIELNYENAAFRMHHGLCDITLSGPNHAHPTGAVTTTNWIYTSKKHIGKSNEVNASEQAVKTVQSRIAKKKVEDYFTYDELLEQSYTDRNRINVMLAETYNTNIIPTTEVFFQPKLDGVRCYIELPSLIARSRYHNRFPRIEIELKNIKSDNLSVFKDEMIFLDGEIYSHGKEVGQIISQLRRGITDCTYNVFDVFIPSKPHLVFSERRKILARIVRILDSPFIKLLHTVTKKVESIEDFHASINVAFEMYKDYEGLMIRMNTPYEHDRSHNLLKCKKMLDREFILVKFIEGTGQSYGIAASAIVQLCYTEEDKKLYPFLNNIIPPQCGVNVTGDNDLRKHYLMNESKLIGSKVTVRFQEYLSSGMIRFGELIAIRDYE